MLVFKPCENLLLLPPKFFTTTTTTTITTNSKPHLLHLHLHHHHVKLLHFSPLLKAHFKSTLSSSPLSSTAAAAAPSEEEEEDSSSSSSLTTTTTVDYFLMDSGGLSYEQAIQVIRQVPTLLRNGGRKPRSVIAYFESIGFSKTHISEAISKYPRVLVADVEKTLKPKIQLFLDFGLSESDIADLTALQPSILTKGLKTHLKPALDLIKSIVKTDEDLIKAIIKRNSFFLLRSINHRKSIEPNMDVLRKHGVPDSEILHLVLSRLQTLMLTPEVFKITVERIVSLGFKPETRMFSTAVLVMSGMKKATWDSKIALLKGLGWSEVQIHDAFRRLSSFLSLSCENLKESIEFFKESLNWDASVLSQHPMILNYSLKKRVIPRYAVFKCLMSKEIIKEDKIFVYMLTMNETKFLSKYVFDYQEQLPYLYDVYEKECMLGCEKDNGLISNQQDHGDVDVTV